MVYNRKEVSTVNDDPQEGKVFVFPQCTSCEYCDGGFCKYFNEERLKLAATHKTDLFNCTGYKSKY